MRRSLRAAGIMAASLWLVSAAPAAPAAGGWTSQVVIDAPVETAVKLNPTGRTYEIEVPLKVDGARLGDVGIKITADDKLFVDAKLLKIYLSKICRPEVLTAALATPEEETVQTESVSVASKKAPGAVNSSVQLVSHPVEAKEQGELAAGKPSYLSLEALKERGLALRYDPLNLELEVLPTVDQRPDSTISFSQKTDEESVTLEQPAFVSAYLNLHLAGGYVAQNSYGGAGLEAPTIDLDGAVRIGAYVLEGEGTVYDRGPQTLSAASFQDYAFYRRAMRLVYDLPDDAIRIRAGDVSPSYTGFQTAPDLLGVSAGIDYAQLKPQASIRPTGAHSFRIERPSNVDILVDDVMVKHIKLGPGNYNLTDLPLNPGANQVKLIIEDDAGERQTLEFSGFSGQELLAPGVSEWSINAGVKSYDSGAIQSASSAAISSPVNTTLANKSPAGSFYSQRQYFFNQPAATGFYRTGIFDWLTAEADAQADTTVVMAGAGFAAQTVNGLVTAKLAASDAYGGGRGVAVQLGYDYEKLKWFGYGAALRLVGEYRTQGFETVGLSLTPVDYSAYLAATYAQHLPWSLTASLSLSYYFMDRASGSEASDRWQADASLSTQLLDNVSAALSLSYGEDKTASASAASRNGFQAFLRLAWTPEARVNVSSSYDSRSQTAQTSVTETSEKTNVDSWSATAIAETTPDGRSDISASGAYFTNRAEFYFNHSAAFDGPGYGGLVRPSSTQEQTSVSVATSLVYADGAWGVGRRVTNGFALVTPHESLQGSPVVIGGQDSIVAQTDWLGPAVVPAASPYRQARVTYDAPDAPAGYDLGSATFDMKAPYKAGYNLKAGSAYTVTAMGTLLNAEGQPLPLLAGEAHEADKENGRKVELFTNRAGRFGAQGLAPGKWIIEMPGEMGKVSYAFEIPAGVSGLHDAGVLKPASGGQQKPPVVEAEADNGTN